jgi:TonB family protein
MLPPDSAKKISGHGQPLTDGSSAFSLENYSDVAQVAKTLSKLGGGAVALALALDLVLNEVVEQARMATGATGAAVALERDGEMVCRATTGQHAPELGTRVETTSGLSGECLRTGEVLYCPDTESDLRVDAEACRELGIRSVLLTPLHDSAGTFGILQAFSSRPNAFGERDMNTLAALGRRIVASKKAAEQGSASPGMSSVAATASDSHEASDEIAGNVNRAELFSVPSSDLEIEENGPDANATIPELFDKTRAELPSVNATYVEVGEPKGNDIWTTVLVILVIAAAVSLGVVIGWRGALQGSVPQTSPEKGLVHDPKSQSSSAVLPPVLAATSAAPPTSSAALPSKQVSAEDAAIPSTSTPGPQAKRSTSGNATETSGGGLTVTENGKVIYRLPAQTVPGESTLSSSSSDPGGRLIRRVNPDYPDEARRKHIQGAVVLNVQVLGNGNVGAIEVSTGDPVLAEAAVHAVRQWKYQPYVVDGRSVQSQTRITIRFTLPSS